jgi:hypothetical protein
MNMPGFTADAAVFQSNYVMAAEASQEAGGGPARVAPQACVNLGPCRVCVTVRYPPRACLQFSCLGFTRSFCVP